MQNSNSTNSLCRTTSNTPPLVTSSASSLAITGNNMTNNLNSNSVLNNNLLTQLNNSTSVNSYLNSNNNANISSLPALTPASNIMKYELSSIANNSTTNISPINPASDGKSSSFT